MELKYFAIKEEVLKQIDSTEHIKIELGMIDPMTRGLQQMFNDMYIEWVWLYLETTF